MTSITMIDNTSTVVWTPETPKPNQGITATGMDNPAIFAAWSYWTWGSKIASGIPAIANDHYRKNKEAP